MQATAKTMIGQVFDNALGKGASAAAELSQSKETFETISNTLGFSDAAGAGRAAAAEPENATLVQDFTSKVGSLLQSSAGKNPMALLYFVFRESIVEQNKDKNYMIQKLKQLNSIGGALGDYLNELKGSLNDLQSDTGQSSAKISKSRGDGASAGESETWMNASQLLQEIEAVESDQETIRSRRQLATTAFENANKKSTQYMNMMSSVLKGMQESNKGIVRNIG